MNRIKVLLAIFFITFSTILVEILYTRVFATIYFSSFAFLIISLALFGYGVSGVFVSLSKISEKKSIIKWIETVFLIYSLSLPLIYKLTLTAKIDFFHLFSPVGNILLLLLNFFILAIPFFLAGLVLVLIFSMYSQQIGKLYFIDLIGGALGAVAIIPLIMVLGPTRIILSISFILAIFWFFISRYSIIKKGIPILIIMGILAFLFVEADTVFPVIPKLIKRNYLNDYAQGKIEYSKWSPINKIDIADTSRLGKIIWLNGGTQQSRLVRYNPLVQGEKKPIKWFQQSIPFQLAQKKRSAFIIGSAGGLEVLCAISHKFKSTYAVEMDPVICRIVSQTPYASYIGGIFRRKGVHLINDEGRSVLKRMKDVKFDVIQMVNSHPTDTLLSGGLSVSETYIYTIESMKDYWNHLHENGFLSIIHVYGERMFATAFQALRELGVDQPENKFIVLQAPLGFNYFFMKKGNIDQRDIDIMSQFVQAQRKQFALHIMYSPDRELDNIYYKLATPEYRSVIAASSVNISPVRDISPYFNQPNKIGQFRFSNNVLKGMARQMIDRALVYSNSVYLSILFCTILFSVVLLYLPLRLKSRGKVGFAVVFYFSLIGFGFITVEIILIKIFQLLLGNPAYSISVIIFSLLVSSGIGSLLSSRINRLFKNKTILILSLFIMTVLLIYSLFLFPIISSLIHLSLGMRILLSLILISILGFPMGTFFPTGLKFFSESNKNIIGWAWGANSFATVFGSVTTVIVAINWNFGLSLVLAAVSYLLAGLIFYRSLRKIK
ncbi:MAG: hypothetical protein KAT17_02760 [Candidatus Aminicenantes bacterium]|nr:hypothetical protein [Candidatus Aminicenantes bacterium]